MTRRVTLLTLVAAVSGCTDQSGHRAKEQLDALQRRKADAAKVQKPVAAAPQLFHVSAPYDELQSTLLSSDGQCPDGLWALFPGEAPGATPDEKRVNEARRPELAKALLNRPFLVRLQAPGKVTLQPHDAANGRFVVEVAGAVDCIDSAGHVTVAWTEAKAIETPPSAVSRGAEVLPNLWQAPPLTFELPMKGLSEAKAFYDANRLGLSARVAVTLNKAEVDTKLRKVGKVTKALPDETVGYGGGVEDWGAGRLVRAALVGVRVAAEQEKKELIERRGP